MSIDLSNEPSFHRENMQNDAVQTIEKRMAKMFEKENAIYLPTRYVSNMCAVLSQYGSNGKILLGDKSHMYLFDKVQCRFNGISWKSVPTLQNGAIQLEKIDIDTDNIGMICIEDMGIQKYPNPYLESLHEIAGGLPIHLDGIHIWNSIIRKKIVPSESAKYFNSMTIHLSKCSGGSYGTILLGSNEFIEKARSVKNMITQNDSVKMATSFLEILDDYESGVLEDTYTKAKKIAEAMNRLKIFKVQPVETNVIFADVMKPLDANTITKIMKENGVIISTWAHQLVRLVIHKNVSDSNVKTIINALQKLQERVHIFEMH
jgi:threonine aldolase